MLPIILYMWHFITGYRVIFIKILVILIFENFRKHVLKLKNIFSKNGQEINVQNQTL